MRGCVCFVLLLVSCPWWRAASADASLPPEPSARLLREAVDRWAGEREFWAFSQHVREYRRDRVKEHRVERYDPSQSDARRWTLLALNGREPTAREQAAYRERKGRKRSFHNSPADYIDFARVAVLADTPGLTVFAVPLRDDISLWVPFEKIAINVAVNKRTGAIADIRVGLHEPFAIAFGLARVYDLDFDLHVGWSDEAAAPEPESAQPDGVARATLAKFGTRVEMAWFDFERVTPAGALAAANAPHAGAGERQRDNRGE